MGLAGQSPVKPGVKSDIPKCAYNSLCVEFESYVRINQLNRRDDKLTFDKLAAKINETMIHDYKKKLLNRVLFNLAQQSILTHRRWSIVRIAGLDGQRGRT